jgi:hypothetical protein
MEFLPCEQNFYNKNLKGRELWEHPMCRWGDNVKWVHKEIRWDLVDWIHLAQDKDQFQTLVNAAVSSSNKSDEFLE